MMTFKEIEQRIRKDRHAQRGLEKFRGAFQSFAQRTGIAIIDEGLYVQAFMHSSYINDLQMDKIYNNERLEFLGDAVLELMVSDYIYNRFQSLPEGDLTKLRANIVCEPSLVVFASKLEMQPLILLGRGEEKTGGRERPSIVSDTFEAFLGALYLDQGTDAAREFLERHVFPEVRDSDYNAVIDYKTGLQEKMHKTERKSVEYQLLEATGPSHDKTFVTGVFADGEMIGRGTGRSKKESEQKAAEDALSEMENREKR
ncbi:ribonuclease III [Salinicoccus roseus]|uniref:Ribonuclease 3 n=2 Tax=Salinicoccus roseus TaxID=45670 RepID=A0ABT4YHV6_9STAP|nr:ribonuclease III [Salinicoccus roseus]MDB0580289.1 ribonuclease III [Salinicoccus roseus]